MCLYTRNRLIKNAKWIYVEIASFKMDWERQFSYFLSSCNVRFAEKPFFRAGGVQIVTKILWVGYPCSSRLRSRRYKSDLKTYFLFLISDRCVFVKNMDDKWPLFFYFLTISKSKIRIFDFFWKVFRTRMNFQFYRFQDHSLFQVVLQ